MRSCSVWRSQRDFDSFDFFITSDTIEQVEKNIYLAETRVYTRRLSLLSSSSRRQIYLPDSCSLMYYECSSQFLWQYKHQFQFIVIITATDTDTILN